MCYIYSLPYMRWAKKQNVFRADNSETVSGRKACYMSKVSKFSPKKY